MTQNQTVPQLEGSSNPPHLPKSFSHPQFYPRLPVVVEELPEQRNDLEPGHASKPTSSRSTSPFYHLQFNTFLPPESPEPGIVEAGRPSLMTREATTPQQFSPASHETRQLFEGVKEIWDPNYTPRKRASEGLICAFSTIESGPALTVTAPTPTRSSSGTFASKADQDTIEQNTLTSASMSAPRRQLFPDSGQAQKIRIPPTDMGFSPRNNKNPDNFNDESTPIASSASSYGSSDQSGGGVAIASRNVAHAQERTAPGFIFDKPLGGKPRLQSPIELPTNPTQTFENNLGTKITKTSNIDATAKHLSGLNVPGRGANYVAYGDRGRDSAVFTQEASSLTDNQKRVRAKALAAFVIAGGCEQSESSTMMPIPMSAAMARGTPAESNITAWPAITSSNATAVPPPQTLEGTMGMLGKPVRINHAPDSVTQRWLDQNKPVWSEIVENLVFAEPIRVHGMPNYSVIKLSQIPYNVTKQDIMAIFGPQAGIVEAPMGTPSCGIHIIMERATAKSMDCYVEMQSERQRDTVLGRLQSSSDRRKLGNRHFEAERSSQEALMKELFPRAKCVISKDAIPNIQAPASSGSAHFNGFVTSEEITMTIKFAQAPQRSRFALKHPERPFESMISLLLKYPWYAVSLYRLKERDLIFNGVRQMIQGLVVKLRGQKPPTSLDGKLLDDLVQASLTCPSFSEKQRAELIDALDGHSIPCVYVLSSAHSWPFDILNRNEDSSQSALLYVVGLIKKASTPTITEETTTNEVIAMCAATGGHVDRYWGAFRVDYPDDKHEMTVGEIAALEWAAINDALEKVVYNDYQ